MTDHIDEEVAPIQLREEDKAKVRNIIEVGIKTKSEMDTLKESLNDAVKDLATELGIKPAQINKAIRIAYKSSVKKIQAEVDAVEVLLHAAGRV